MLVSRGNPPNGKQTIILQVGQAPKTFKAVITLQAGNNVITHNLALTAPLFASSLEVQEFSTGADVSLRIVQETANTLTVYSINPQKVTITVVA
jgi:hypothetical protein